MTIPEYLEKINTRYKTGLSTEHTFRGDLQSLIETLVPDIIVTNEPTRVACGAPDYIITKRKIPVGYIEAKDLGADLNSKSYKEQFDRYRSSLPNLIITDYLNFQLFVEGNFVTSISLAEIQGNNIVAKSENFETFTGLLKNFCSYAGQTIKSPSKLAVMMAAKARLLANTIEKALSDDEANNENMLYESANNSIRQQLTAFQQHLIHDITAKEFSGIYAQTIAYGMFAARYHDSSLNDFTRQEAAELIPKTNPFLRKLFQYIAGYDLDERIKWIVDELVTIFQAADVTAIMNNFGKTTQQTDPIIHFYETFLSEYDPKLRKARGVWYTPQPVVNFIVRAVDDILKTEFGLPDGLADTTKTKITVKIPTHDKRFQAGMRDYEHEVHKVQILDPACGTGTFLAEIVKHIYKRFEGQQGIWSQYAENHLIPRLNGFELLMASYSMAHLKMDMLFNETGYRPQKEQRFRIYLTNSLEEYHPDTGTLFASWLSDEADEANRVKRDTPVMVIIGNPPYSGESANKGEWIMNLMEDYKKEPGGKEKLKEKNSKFINDDYVKFLRYGQHFIEKNGSGILAFINPHGFIDNPTFRGMRWNLLKTYDKIFIIDLHGNAKKKEISPDGSADINVFDIEQGVSINFFIKTGKKIQNDLGQIYHFDFFGKREMKYDFLLNNNLKTTPYITLKNVAPHFFFKPKDLIEQIHYDRGFYLPELFSENSLGVLSKNDDVTIDFDKNTLNNRITNFISLDENIVKKNYKIKEDSRDWILSKAILDLKENNKVDNYKLITYRPFDNRWTFFTGRPKGFFAYSQNRIMKNLKVVNNYAIISGRQGQAVGSMQWNLSFITNTISDQNIFYRGGGTVFPLYLCQENSGQLSTEQTPERTPNLNSEIVNQIAEKLCLTFTPEKEQTDNTFAPIDILDYIYALLHSPTYREKYKEFLKFDFPRVPYPENKETFWQLVKLGGELRQLHLLESPRVNQFITTYPEDGTNEVTKLRFEGEGLHSPTDSPEGGEPAYPLDDDDYDDNKVMEYGWQTGAPGYYRVLKEDKDRLKADMTEAERVLWQELRGKRLGVRFRRQHIVGCFIPDFVCLWYKLIIEVDGKIHDFRKEYDESRTARLNELGFEVIRFRNEDVLNDIDTVLEKIKATLKQREHIATAAKNENPSYFSGHPALSLLRRAGEADTKNPEVEYGEAEAKNRLAQRAHTDSPEGGGPADTQEDDGKTLKEKTGVAGKIWINETQYFAGVPQVAWEFYIGGYQPAQKWLKDRKGRVLSFEDMLHYQKIIVALTETERVMGEIDEIQIG